MVYQGNTFRSLAGNIWATNHCSLDRTVDAGGSVTGAVPSRAFLREIREQLRENQEKNEPNIFYIDIC
jgi:hypothetical protein